MDAEILGIILQIEVDKKARKVTPSHATDNEVYAICKSRDIDLNKARDSLNSLQKSRKIKAGPTINAKYITVL
ncbi:hypothetical protein E2605_14835 [Dysgonomonas capnocytophagoides]|uniref:Uncharacterized protein n=1 Tax=Dysgonomonas capnocytophagoides TaxID=45254 RepID=A0A4Y8KYB5_9BACT|nr:hypothetical protein [Dysgonomonas capnocytophagoides]TFD94646.1 hypothetical protein E2605_14835 [Dysgonomonas capnocytophagoides]